MLCDNRFVGHENDIQNAPCNRPLNLNLNLNLNFNLNLSLNLLSVSPHEHWLVDVCRERIDHSPLLNLLVQDHLCGDASGKPDALGHGRVARLNHRRLPRAAKQMRRNAIMFFSPFF
jgi:hypothetical protein